MVQLIRQKRTHHEFVLKAFASHATFAAEAGLYTDPSTPLGDFLPQAKAIVDNADGDNDPTTGIDAFYGAPTAAANSLWWFDHKFPEAGVVPPAYTEADLIEDLATRVLGRQARRGKPLRVQGLPQAATGPAFSATVTILTWGLRLPNISRGP